MIFPNMDPDMGLSWLVMASWRILGDKRKLEIELEAGGG
jgi:hypothetical protein